jgi:hypothetical protein
MPATRLAVPYTGKISKIYQVMSLFHYPVKVKSILPPMLLKPGEQQKTFKLNTGECSENVRKYKNMIIRG